jgi:hypothetical protein
VLAGANRVNLAHVAESAVGTGAALVLWWGVRQLAALLAYRAARRRFR